MQPNIDPYRPLEQNLKSGDWINRWVLMRPRQRIVQLLKGQRVLDVCCGTGNLTAMLAAAGCQVVGVDSSPTMLSHARQKQIAAEFKQMDAAQLPFHQEFDAAVISIALHEILPQVREKVWESMRSGGLLSWIQKQGQPVEAVYHFWGGIVAVVVTRQSPSENIPFPP